MNKKKIEVSPDFLVKTRISDIMIRGHDFYAAWDEENGLWTTDESRVAEMIDNLTASEYEKLINSDGYTDSNVVPLYMQNFSSGKWLQWTRYVASLPDKYHKLDNKLVFADTPVNKKDYASKKLGYSLSNGSIESYEELMNTLYEPSERMKLEWAIGSVISGDSKKLQKFIVMYGEAGTGKGTVLKIIEKLFDGYYAPFTAKELTGKNNDFALEQFKNNPLVAIDSDADLSKIEDNTLLNSIVSHEIMSINEKFKAKYSAKFDSMLFMGSNSPVKITNTKSGLLRRLIDVYPTGKKIDGRRYNNLMKHIDFELGAIAKYCLTTYNEMGFHYYDNYIPQEMLVQTNDFYNFIEENILVFIDAEYITLNQAWKMYLEYCNDANITYPYTKRIFKTEFKGYFEKFEERYWNGTEGIRNVYTGFLIDKFNSKTGSKIVSDATSIQSIDENTEIKDVFDWIKLEMIDSKFDITCKDCVAQYDSGHGSPMFKWINVVTKLADISTKRLHYVRVPLNHIVVDFDLKDTDGNKSLELNLNAAKAFPPTYAEVSKSGQGLHLHYIYDGDPLMLANLYAPDIEIKVFTGCSSLRRKKTLCNNLDIAHISGGLPLKEEKPKMLSAVVIKNEKALRTLIKRHIRKEIVSSTRQSVDLINDILERAYEQGFHYDVRDLQSVLIHFASTSTHQHQYCINKVAKMKLCSKDSREDENEQLEKPIAIFDVEIFPNVFILCYKKLNCDDVKILINPEPHEVESVVVGNRLIGFNNRKYDNHILYARMLGYSLRALFELSQKLIDDKIRDTGFLEAYNISYADVHDFSSKKQSLKKWEIELGAHHHENAYAWDKDLPEDKWQEVAEYCCDDVRATELVFKAREEDYVARQILSAWSGLTINSSTRMHATRIIFGKEKYPTLNYVDLRKDFPGYEYSNGVSTYMGEVTGEGGYVYAEPGIYFDVALLDIASMHPHSILAMNMFGDYTKRFKDLVDCRIAIKQHEYEKAKEMLPESVWSYLTDEYSKALSYALKIVINSIYGYTKAGFENPFRDRRNIDNIVAKRGALFMINLKHEVQKRGYTVAHIKTDSIKIPNATQEIVDFVTEYGESFGYFFDWEDTYERMCLVNDAVYIAKHRDGSWTATGAQFKVPYVFKTLFSKEPIEFKDLCETKSVSSSLYLDFNEQLPAGEHNYVFVGRVGLFCPVKPGNGGAMLLRKSINTKGEEKYDSVSGAKDYRWLESETINEDNIMTIIDIRYYDKLVQDAIAAITAFGDANKFIFE